MKIPILRAGALVVAGSLTLAACSTPTSTASGDVSEQAAGDTLADITSSGTITIGVKNDTPPYGFVPQGQSEPVGFDIDLATELAQRLDVELELVTVTSANRIANLETDKVDALVSSLVHTRSRDETIDYTIAYFEDEQRILVPPDSEIDQLQDLAGKKVAVGQGSIQEQIIKVAVPDAEVLSVAKWSDTLQALETNQVDAIFSAAGVLAGLAETAQSAGTDLRIVGEPGIAPIPYAIGVRQGDAALRDALNLHLMEIVEDGTYATIFEEWWGDVYDDPYQVRVVPE